jgi:hypothetical protein
MDNMELHNEVMFYKKAVERMGDELQKLRKELQDMHGEIATYSVTVKRLSSQLDMAKEFGDTL